MTALPAGIAAVAVPLVLLGSAAGHAARPGALASALRAQGVLPAVLSRPLAVLVTAVEAAAGACVAAAALRALDGTFRAASLASALLLALYALYAAHVARTRGGVPCGCSGGIGAPMTGWIAVRAAALAALALTGAARGLPGGTSGYETSVIVTAGLGFAVILWTLPYAMIEERSPG
ncbi:MauE/DoxX family redox-associated membrane protein [Actinomadura litoris]|uniref:MauE/DoxX family redox-associated membrane protein n=1 Tax=Actinomadura litoris TaxID=2678616 RepID=UPI001FA7A488|nr:MauE/DoxX family redox-associated membrane protein [Actinomadura litoris]